MFARAFIFRVGAIGPLAGPFLVDVCGVHVICFCEGGHFVCLCDRPSGWSGGAKGGAICDARESHTRSRLVFFWLANIPAWTSGGGD